MRMYRKMKIKIIIGLSLLLVLIIAVAAVACPGEADTTSEELLEKMAEAIHNVGSYQIGMETTMYLKTVIHGETIEIAGLVHSTGQFDLINQRARTTMMLEPATSPEADLPGEVAEWEMYRINGMMYVNVPIIPGIPSMWIKGDMPWVCSLEQMLDLLKASQIDILRVEEVNGVESYLISVSPDLGKLWQMLNKGMLLGPPGILLNPGATGVATEEIFRNVSMKQWISRDTFLPVKEQLQMTVVFEGIEMHQEMELGIASRFYGFNDPVTIELPLVAEGAKEVPQW